MSTDAFPPQQEGPKRRDDPRSTATLLAGALADDEDGACVLALQYRGTREVFDAAVALCQSPIAGERGIGVWILGQLGVTPPTFVAESVDVLLAMLASELDIEVLQNVAVALGHRRDPRAIEPLIDLRHHPEAYVRYGVALALMNFDDDRVIGPLISLSGDVDETVRDWATFGLGSIQDADTPQVRDALFARVTDADGQVRGEAMVGLARRRDPRVTEPIRLELAGNAPGELAIRAATEFPHPSFVPHLLALADSQNVAETSEEDIAEAISRCSDPGAVFPPGPGDHVTPVDQDDDRDEQQ